VPWEVVLNDSRNFLANDVAGVYVLHNSTKDLYCIGASTQVYHTMFKHFIGDGNEKLYQDKRNGNRFSVRAIALNGSGYSDCIELRDAVRKSYGGGRY
jgi:hypothetical protein